MPSEHMKTSLYYQLQGINFHVLVYIVALTRTNLKNDLVHFLKINNNRVFLESCV